MELSNKFKVILWGISVGLLSYLMSQRLNSLTSGQANATDIAIFIIWIAVLVAPLFREVTFFGVSLKRELENLKNEVREQILNLRTDVQNTINMRQEISTHVYHPTPPPDSELPDIEQRIKPIMEQTFKEHGMEKPILTPEEQLVPKDTQYFFSVRYAIENELRRIWRLLHTPKTNLWRYYITHQWLERETHSLSVIQIAHYLVIFEVINPQLANAIRNVLAICNQAVHGENVSDAQAKFVRNVASGLIASLKAIE
jgi:hypothetical protein